MEDFDDLLEFFQRKKAPCNENDLGENIKLDRLIVMDDVLSLADRSETFANFLTVSRKFGLTYVYIFHAVYPTRQNWQMILAQTKIFHIFPGSIQASSIVKILSSFCNSIGTIKYQTETFGLTDYTLTYQVQVKNSA